MCVQNVFCGMRVEILLRECRSLYIPHSTHMPHSPHTLMTIWILEVPLTMEIGDADGKIVEIVAVVMNLTRFSCGHCTTSQGSLD